MTRDKATRAHLGRMAESGCICCHLMHGSFSAAQIHHPRQFAGGGQRCDDWLAFGLCADCHQGRNGVHGDKTYLRILNMDEAQLLAAALRRVYG